MPSSEIGGIVDRGQLSAGKIKTQSEEALSPYALPISKLNSTGSNLISNNNFNFLSQNESPLIKLVKDGGGVGGGPMAGNLAGGNSTH